MSPLRLNVLPLLLALIALLNASAALGHAVLKSSTPAPNGTLPAGASVLALRFSETVETDRTTATIVGPAGQIIPATTVRVPGEPQVVRLETEVLEPGTHTVRWRALSVDGDITQGSFRFTVEPVRQTSETQTPAQPNLVPEPRREEQVPVAAWEPTPDEPRLRTVTGLLRAFMVGGILGLTGAAFFWLEIQGESRLPPRRANTLLVLAALATAGAAGGFADLASRLGASLAGTLETTAGKLLAFMGVLALAQLVIAVMIRSRVGRTERAAMGLLIALGSIALLTNTVAGHAIAGDDLDTAAGDLLLLATAVHIAVVVLWVGGVIALVVSASKLSGEDLGALMAGFSRWAITGVVLLAVTGVIMATDALRQPSDLTETVYGRMIVFKSAGFGVLLSFGAWHRYRARPERGALATKQTRRTLTAELVVMGAVIVLAGVLAVSPQPAEPVDLKAGPAVGHVRELDFGDYRGQLLLPDPLSARPEQMLWLQLRSRTFADPAEIEPRLFLRAPAGSSFTHRELSLELLEKGRWKARGPIFPVSGEWHLRIEASGPRGSADTTLVINVAPSH